MLCGYISIWSLFLLEFAFKHVCDVIINLRQDLAMGHYELIINQAQLLKLQIFQLSGNKGGSQKAVVKRQWSNGSSQKAAFKRWQ